eukprot:6270157-Amphidinium_carterae.1
MEHGEHLDWLRVEPGLPPMKHCAAIDSVWLAEGAVREYFLHPECAVCDVSSLSLRPRPGKVCIVSSSKVSLIQGLLERRL